MERILETIGIENLKSAKLTWTATEQESGYAAAAKMAATVTDRRELKEPVTAVPASCN